MAKAKDNSALYDEARELGIEPARYGEDTEALQARIDHVRAEREVVLAGQEPVEADDTEVEDDGVMTTENTPADKPADNA